jgi:hypothetical protein
VALPEVWERFQVKNCKRKPPCIQQEVVSGFLFEYAIPVFAVYRLTLFCVDDYTMLVWNEDSPIQSSVGESFSFIL